MTEPSAPDDRPSHAPSASAHESALADAIAHSGKSLLVLRPTRAELDSLGQRLASKLQHRVPNLQVTHFSGQHSTSLLGYLNHTLARQTLAHATQMRSGETVQQVCMVHHADRLTADELRLLQRMAEDLPGWQTRLVLLYQTGLDSSDKIEALTQCSGQVWIIWRMEHTNDTTTEPNTTQQTWIWATGLGSLVLLGIAAVVWQGFFQAPSYKRASIKPAVTNSTAAPAALPSAAVPASSPSDQTVAPALVPAVSSAAVPTPTTVAPAIAPPPAAPDMAAAASVPAMAAKSPSTSPAPLPNVAARGYRWVSGLPQDAFVITHGSHDSVALAQQQIKSRAELSNARILMLQATEEAPSRFVVVTGPFRSKDRAQNFRARQKLPAGTSIDLVSKVLQQSRQPVKGPAK